MIVLNLTLSTIVLLFAFISFIDLLINGVKTLRRLARGERRLWILAAQLGESYSRHARQILDKNDPDTQYVTLERDSIRRIENLRVLSENFSKEDAINYALDLYTELHKRAAEGYTNLSLEHSYLPSLSFSLDQLKNPKKKEG